jgi:hypothetical protein
MILNLHSIIRFASNQTDHHLTCLNRQIIFNFQMTLRRYFLPDKYSRLLCKQTFLRFVNAFSEGSYGKILGVIRITPHCHRRDRRNRSETRALSFRGGGGLRLTLFWLCACVYEKQPRPIRLVFLRPGLDSRIHPKFYCAKRRFLLTSKCRHIYGVLNIDEIKN